MKRVAITSSTSRLTLFWGLIFGLAVLIFGAVVVDAAPVIEQKVDSLRYRILEMMPPPPHTEYVPTPLATPTRLAKSVSPSGTPTATDLPDPTAAATATARPTRTATAFQKPQAPTGGNFKPIQASVHLTGVTNDYQRWNNCGPTTLEMALSFFGHHHSQAEIAAVLKPDPDDKNVRPDEMAAYATTDGINVALRVNGTLDRIKLFLSNGLPVVVETGFDPPRAHEGWMGHYRLVTAYDDQNWITQDSYDGPNVPVALDALDADWKAFNRTYLVLYTDAQAPVVPAILGDDVNDAAMYSHAFERAQQEFSANPQDAFAAFNLGSSLVGLKRYPEAAAAFDRARLLKLPWRMLWYQFGPYQAYYRAGRYDELIALANATLAVADDLEESHYYKGLSLQALGNTAEARREFTTALRYNKNYADASAALAILGQ